MIEGGFSIRSALVFLLVLGACRPTDRAQQPDAAPPSATAPATSVAPATGPDAATSTARAAYRDSPASPIRSDTCPIDDEFIDDDAWPGCPLVPPFEDLLLRIGVAPCRQTMSEHGVVKLTTTFERDANGRLLSLTMSGSSKSERHFAYDTAGRLIESASGGGRYGPSHTTAPMARRVDANAEVIAKLTGPALTYVVCCSPKQIRSRGQ